MDTSGLLEPHDASTTNDAATSDALAPDVRGFDAGSLDAGVRDVGPGVDARMADVGPMTDVGPMLDARPMDAGRDVGTDAGNDAGPMDAGPRDMGVDVDICATGPDSDGDGVSDACDECAGEDDRIDVDGDGIPDACDPWPCNDVPTPPGVVNAEFIEISNVQLGDGTNRTVVAPDSMVRVRFEWTLNDVNCVGCRNQIEVGSGRSGRIGCAYDGFPGAGGTAGRIDTIVRVGPRGVAELRFNLGRNGSGCEEGAGWWPVAPDATNNFALICVN